jgi:hypothetical protein
MKRMIWIGIVSAILGIGHLISVAIASPLAPPPEYDHGFVGVVTVTRVSDRGKMEEICRKPRAIGCASHYTAGGCHIYVLDDETLSRLVVPIPYLLIYRHEIAHCNGWPADHPMYDARNPAPLTPTLIPVKPVAVPVILFSNDVLIEYGKRRAKELGMQ